MKSTHKKEIEQLVSGTIAKIRQRQPNLHNPEGLTEDIMKAIREDSKDNNFKITEKSRKFPVIIILKRILAAASVCLFLLFGYEEYVVVDKISRLEQQNAAISQSPQYQSALKLQKVVSILASDPGMLNRYKELKTRKINPQTLFKAVMYIEMAGITPDALKWMNRTGYNIAKPSFMSILNQFDSTHYILQQ